MTCTIFDIPINTTNRGSLIDLIISSPRGSSALQIITANAIMLDAARHNPQLARVFTKAYVVIADSIGVCWAARLLHQEVPDLIPGIDLMIDLIRHAAEHQRSVYLLGAREPVIAKTAAVLQQLYPGLIIAGYHHGYIDLDSDAVVEQIRSSAPDMLFVGLATPEQELWISRNLTRFNARIVMGVGGSFDVISGTLKRAPAVFRSAGLEWLFRFMQQPWRICRSWYLIRFVAFIFFQKLRVQTITRR
jgi:N-acetylglucosaminyldiphosphoundecaprenol N-acetyl-beta-D-mannosaminyltransferase